MSWYGLKGGDSNYSFFICGACEDPHCISCFEDATICTSCTVSYGVNESKKCSPCSKDKCLECPNNYKWCSVCDNGFGLDPMLSIMGECFPCSVPFCSLCGSNFQTCESCSLGFVLEGP